MNLTTQSTTQCYNYLFSENNGTVCVREMLTFQHIIKINLSRQNTYIRSPRYYIIALISRSFLIKTHFNGTIFESVLWELLYARLNFDTQNTFRAENLII
jgi:hypothetical protein